ncbi:tubulin nucleotide-binding domain-like protein [Calocera viscosa TUFC12733]|uniref:Tubulin nucleotide-binding domain-like protein n=1 Tax=Calocera viscosa (strain TUFC12733) TaxID=1330018 RepID=A0A167NBW1_CALVF|nr:tubulin nucleotide-binding domain-like protein [Calocera viscosa TUFC12733]
MHEIIYIQSGTYANYIGQHFWNVQESYFDWNEDPEDTGERRPPEVNHDVSFRQGMGTDGTPTYLPRVLIFDTKDAFGSLSKYNAMYQAVVGEEAVSPSIWAGASTSLRQQPYPKSQYQRDLENEVVGVPSKGGPSQPVPSRKAYNPSTWADYTRVYYHPRSIWPVTYNLGGNGNKWEEGEEVWNRLREQEDDFWDRDFRLFAEECDLLQGVQMTSSGSDAFASLSVSLLQTFQDEYPKLPSLVFLPLSQRKARFNTYDLAERRRIACESKALTMLTEIEATIVPLQHPATWLRGKWASGLAADINFGSAYQTSALLSAQIESATLPLRLNGNLTSLNSLTSLLNDHADTPFSQLSGAFPLSDVHFADKVWDFSTAVDSSVIDPMMYSACTTYRGILSLSDRDTLQERLEQSMGIREPLLKLSLTQLQYPILTSYPPILSEYADTIPLMSILHTSSRTASLLEHYTTALQGLLDENQFAGLGEGLGRDDIRAMRAELVNLREGYVQTDGFELSDEEREEDDDII